MRNLLKIGLHINVGGQDTIACLSCPPSPPPLYTLLILALVRSSMPTKSMRYIIKI